MFVEKKKISNVTGFKCYENECYINENGVVKNEDRIVLNDIEGFSFWKITNNSYYYFNLEGDRIYVNQDKVNVTKYPLFVNLLDPKKSLCKANFRRENRKWLWCLGLYDLETNLLLAENQNIKNFNVIKAADNYCIGYYEVKETIYCLSIEDFGKTIWKLYLGGFSLSSVVGSTASLLYMAITEEILEINLSNGMITRRWKGLPGLEVENMFKDVIPEPSQFNLDHNQEKLIGTFDTYYIEIDLKSGEASYRNLKEELESHHISDFRPFNNHPFDENHLFLTTHTYLPEYPNVDLSSVVALNRDTFKIDWMHTFIDASIGTNIPKITKTHLYQRDTEKNLFIFERIDQPA